MTWQYIAARSAWRAETPGCVWTIMALADGWFMLTVREHGVPRRVGAVPTFEDAARAALALAEGEE